MTGLAQPITLRGRPAEAYEPSMSAPKLLAGEESTGGTPDADLGFTKTSRASASPASVIGIICAGDLATHRPEVKAAIVRGLAESPDAVWVCIEPRSDRMTYDVMTSLDIDPVVLPMNSAWRYRAKDDGRDHTNYDLRRLWRDLEMLHLCDQLIVFHKASSSSPWRDRVKSGLYDQRLYLVEIGPQPKARGRKTITQKEYT